MRSDLYTITFTTIITVILGLGLSATAAVSYTHLTLPTKA